MKALTFVPENGEVLDGIALDQQEGTIGLEIGDLSSPEPANGLWVVADGTLHDTLLTESDDDGDYSLVTDARIILARDRHARKDTYRFSADTLRDLGHLLVFANGRPDEEADDESIGYTFQGDLVRSVVRPPSPPKMVVYGADQEVLYEEWLLTMVPGDMLFGRSTRDEKVGNIAVNSGGHLMTLPLSDWKSFEKFKHNVKKLHKQKLRANTNSATISDEIFSISDEVERLDPRTRELGAAAVTWADVKEEIGALRARMGNIRQR